MRPEPLVMTTKFTITRIANTIIPITKLPLITKLPKASMTWPAAAVPSWPCDRISRVEAMFSDSRSMVEISSTVGNAENSSGAWMNREVIRIRIETVIEIARNRSSTSEGSGRISTTRMVRTPNASARSPRFRISPISLKDWKLAAGACAALTRRDIDHGSAPPAIDARGRQTSARRPKGHRSESEAPHWRPRGSSRSTRPTTLDFTRQFLPGVWLAKG